MYKPRILIVDDEENVRKALQQWFQVCGFEVDIAEDGDIAVEKCTATEYDVVTMDMHMPRMSGTAAIAAIRVIRPEVPVIVFTGYYDNWDEAVQCGATKVLNKPMSLHDLEAEVRKFVTPERLET